MPFTVTHNGTADLTYAQTRHRELWTPTRGVRATILEDTWRDHVAAVALVLPAGAAFSHSTAARLIGLPLPQLSPYPLEVTREGAKIRRHGVRGYQRHLTGEVEIWHGLPATRPLRTWRDLGGRLDIPHLVAIADVLLRRALCTEEDLHDLHGVHHRKLLQQAANLADAGSWSPRESLLRVAMRTRGLPAPELNGLIVEDGDVLGRGDFVWREWRVIADYDGGHHGHARQRHQDAQTRDDYRFGNWDHVPLTSAMDLTQTAHRVERALRKKGWAPS